MWAPAWSIGWKASLIFGLLLSVIDLMLRPKRGVITAVRQIEPDYRVGHAGHYNLRLANHGEMVLHVDTREVLPASCEPREHRASVDLRPGEERSITIEFVGKERGRFRVAPTTLRVRSKFGLFVYQEVASVKDDELAVFPGRPAAETATLLSRARLLEEAGLRVVRRLGYDSDFESLRDYVVGDDLRFVDWKATARRQHPQVRQYQLERSAEVILALDCGRLMGNVVRGVAKLDLALTPILDLASVAIQRGERVGLLAFDSSVLSYVPPRGKVRQLGLMIQALTNLQTSYQQTSFTRAVAHLETHHKKRSVVVVFTDFTDEISSLDLQMALKGLSRRHVLLFVAVGDPHLQDILEEPPRAESAPFQKAAAAELLVERRRVMHSMSRAGVLALDADPFTLTPGLISRYLEARTRV